MKKKQRLSSENNNTNYYSPLNHLKDAQGFAEKILSRLQSFNERFEVKKMILKVIARTVGLHHLILLNFYPYLQKYVQPHQRDATNLLAATVQACHDMAITVGLNVLREICLRMPLLMTEDLLQDLVLHRKSHEKERFALHYWSRSIEKDPPTPKARPKAFGEVNVSRNIPDIELLEQDNNSDEDIDEESFLGEDYQKDDDDGLTEMDDNGDSDGDAELESSGSSDYDVDMEDDVDADSEDDGQEDEVSGEEDHNSTTDDFGDGSDEEESEGIAEKELEESSGSKTQKRKFSDFEGQLNAANNSLRALKKLAGVKAKNDASYVNDGILSNEDFQRIKDLKAKEEARIALTQHGFKVPSSDQLS